MTAAAASIRSARSGSCSFAVATASGSASPRTSKRAAPSVSSKKRFHADAPVTSFSARICSSGSVRTCRRASRRELQVVAVERERGLGRERAGRRLVQPRPLDAGEDERLPDAGRRLADPLQERAARGVVGVRAPGEEGVGRGAPGAVVDPADGVVERGGARGCGRGVGVVRERRDRPPVLGCERLGVGRRLREVGVEVASEA